ncbi:hypothetical protein PGDDIFCJ_00178 [Thermus phage YS40_Isch]|nr:hypothetical protein PGDDIFCJ_00178 [Thermus phage YS40_Isch]
MAKLLGNTTIGDKRLLHIYLDVGGISETRYYKIATISRENGILQVNGILGGHTTTEGRGLVNVSFSLRTQPGIWGNVSGYLNSSDLIFYVPVDNSLPGEVWLKVTTWGLVNLEVSAVGLADIVYDGTYSTSPPSSSNGTLHYLSKNYRGIHRSAYSSADQYPAYYILNYTLGSGVFVVNGGFFNMYAMPTVIKNSLVEIVITSSISSTGEIGFKGEGLINFSFSPLYDLQQMGIGNVTGVSTFVGGALSGYSRSTNRYRENNYSLYNISWNSGTLTISIKRNRIDRVEDANVPVGVVYFVPYT